MNHAEDNAERLATLVRYEGKLDDRKLTQRQAADACYWVRAELRKTRKLERAADFTNPMRDTWIRHHRRLQHMLGRLVNYVAPNAPARDNSGCDAVLCLFQDEGV